MKLFVIICILILIWIVGIVVYDVTHFHVTEHVFVSDRLEKEHSFVFLTDLHNHRFGKDNEALLSAISAAEPEAILVGGDMMTAHQGADFTVTVELIKKLCERYPVYYASGNHEYRAELYPDIYGSMSADFEEAIRIEGLTRMRNDTVSLSEENLLLSAVEIDREYYSRFHPKEMDESYIEELLGPKETGKFTILLAHNPDFFDIYASYGADLVLSGHVHGGIARLPYIGGVINPGLRLFPKFDSGLFFFREGKSKKVRGTEAKGERLCDGKTRYMVLGRGLGTHTLPIRFLNTAELNVIRLKPKK